MQKYGVSFINEWDKYEVHKKKSQENLKSEKKVDK